MQENERKRNLICSKCEELWSETQLCYCEDCDFEGCPICSTEHVEKGHAVVWRVSLEEIKNPDFAHVCDKASCKHMRFLHTMDEGCMACKARGVEELRCDGFESVIKPYESKSDGEKFWYAFDVAMTIEKGRKAGTDSDLEDYTDPILLIDFCKKNYEGWTDEKIGKLIQQGIESKALQWVRRSAIGESKKNYDGLVLLRIKKN